MGTYSVGHVWISVVVQEKNTSRDKQPPVGEALRTEAVHGGICMIRRDKTITSRQILHQGWEID